jgi:hypothetical protein
MGRHQHHAFAAWYSFNRATPGRGLPRAQSDCCSNGIQQGIVLSLSFAYLQVVNKAIAAELIFVATTNFDQVSLYFMP